MRGHPLVVASLLTPWLVTLWLFVACPIFDTSGVGSGAGTIADASGAQASSGDAATGVESSSGVSTTSATTTATTGLTSDSGTTGTTTVDTETSGNGTTSVATTGDPNGAPYPSCVGPNMCADASHDCVEIVDVGTVVAHLCEPPCLVDGDCPLPASGTAIPFCAATFFCHLSCDNGRVCPDGMTCLAVGGPELCAYEVS